MDYAEKLDAILEAAERIGISVRREALGGEGGGYCLLRGRPVLFVDVQADAATRYERTIRALAPLPELDQVYLRPDVREDWERERKNVTP